MPPECNNRCYNSLRIAENVARLLNTSVFGMYIGMYISASGYPVIKDVRFCVLTTAERMQSNTQKTFIILWKIAGQHWIKVSYLLQES